MSARGWRSFADKLPYSASACQTSRRLVNRLCPATGLFAYVRNYWRRRSALPQYALLLLLAGCGADEPGSREPSIIQVWAHAGQQRERETLQEQVKRFNTGHPGLQVRLTLIPEGSYNAQVQAAAVADELPDLLEFDAPFLYSYVWQGHLRPLDDLLPDTLQADLLPSIIEQGRYHGRLWAVGSYDSGLCLYADRSKLQQAGVRIPTLQNPWSRDEFNAILQRLAQYDADGQVLDLKLNYAGEWYTYAFSPLIQSAGGDLINRRDYLTADHLLNGADAVSAMSTLQSWIRAGRVDANIDDAAFINGRVALAFGGHWNYPQYHDVLGDNLLLLPLPDFGHGPKTGQGSWAWAITAGSRNAEAAAEFVAYLLTDKEILAMTKANSAIPATYSAISLSPRYRTGGPLNLFVRQLDGGYAVPRPRTPAYPVITAAFQKAFDRIRSGTEVQAALDRAVRTIDDEIEDNQGYPLVGRGLKEAQR